jgi:hypothetical protein
MYKGLKLDLRKDTKNTNLRKLERSVTTPVKECGIDIIWTNRSILFSSPEKNLVPSALHDN